MQSLKGIIVSNKMSKAVVVAVDYLFRHPKYKKIIKRTTKLHAHNEIENLKVGDKVEVTPSRSYSKTVHFKITKIL